MSVTETEYIVANEVAKEARSTVIERDSQRAWFEPR